MDNNQEKDILLDYMFSIGFGKTEYGDVFRYHNESKGIIVEAYYDDDEHEFVDGLYAFEESGDDRFQIAYLHYVNTIEEIKLFFSLVGIVI